MLARAKRCGGLIVAHGDAPLLRSPPHLGERAAVSRLGPGHEPVTWNVDTIFGAILTARVGGRFWAAPASDASPAVVIRARTAEEAALLVGSAAPVETYVILPARECRRAAWLKGSVITDDVDPWSLLRPGLRLLAHGDDEWVALGAVAGCAIEILSSGRLGNPGDSPAQIRSRAAEHLLAAEYRDPFTGDLATIQTAIAHLAEWRRVIDANRGIVAACGIGWWKRREIARILQSPEGPPRLFRSERRALRHAARLGGSVAAWPSRISAGFPEAARALGVPLVRVEDGFVRSVGLGSNLVPPSSVTVDRLGIYYDPGGPSDLEAILTHIAFSPTLLERAERLRETIVRGGISKYGSENPQALPERQPGRTLVLVTGQVEDDESVRLGGAGVAGNLDLLRRARALEPEAEIWFRPHPDVDAGHRTGAVRDADALTFADRVVRGGGMAALLDHVDAVHVLTSLSGFEALLRGRRVVCHGVPFFAGWGLTQDLAAVPDRRGRQLLLAELIAGVLVLYPRYLDPATRLPCPPEVLIARMSDGIDYNRLSWVSRLRRLQGRLMKRHRR